MKDGPIEFFRKNYGKTDIDRIEEEYDKIFGPNKFRHYLRSYYRDRKDNYPDDARELKKLIKLLNAHDDRQAALSSDGEEDKRCSNNNCGKEKDFENYVKSILGKDNLIDRNKFIIREGITYIPDIVWQNGNSISIIEVKRCTHNHRLFTAIGQLVYHRAFSPKENTSYEYIVALPDDVFDSIDKHFVKHVEDEFHIHIKPY